MIYLDVKEKVLKLLQKLPYQKKINKEQAIEVFNKIKKEYENSPNTFGSSSGKKESVMELLVIVGNQIAGEYKDCEVSIKQGVPEINKIKSQ